MEPWQPFDSYPPGASLMLYSMPEWWLGLTLIADALRRPRPLPGILPTGALHSPTSTPSIWRVSWTPPGTSRRRAHPDPRLPRGLLAIMRSSLLDEIGEDLPDDRAGQGSARRRRCELARGPATRCCRPDSSRSASASWSPGRSPSRRCSRSPGWACRDRGARRPRLLGAAGHVPGRVGRRDPRQPGRQPGLRRPRPAGAHMTPPSREHRPPRGCPPAQLARGAPAGLGARLAWFRRSRSGMIGLVVLASSCSSPCRPAARRPRGPRGHQGDRRGAGAAVARSTGSAPTTTAARCSPC